MAIPAGEQDSGGNGTVIVWTILTRFGNFEQVRSQPRGVTAAKSWTRWHSASYSWSCSSSLRFGSWHSKCRS